MLPFALNIPWAVLLGLAVASIHALDIDRLLLFADPAAENDAIRRGLSAAELQALRDEQRRDAFQQQQRNFREQDRQRAGAPQPRLDVPILQPNGQIRPSGNSYIK